MSEMTVSHTAYAMVLSALRALIEEVCDIPDVKPHAIGNALNAIERAEQVR